MSADFRHYGRTYGGFGHEVEVHRPAHGYGTGHAPGRDQEAQGLVAEGPTRADPPEGRRRWPGLDRRQDRRGVRVSYQDRREHPRASGDAGIRATIKGDIARFASDPKKMFYYLI